MLLINALLESQFPDGFNTIMSLLQTSYLLQSLTFQHGNPRQSSPNIDPRHCNPTPLQSKTSIARLVQLARHPVENVTEAIEDWFDGTTKAERDRRQSLDDRKQLLYLKLREVLTLVFLAHMDRKRLTRP